MNNNDLINKTTNKYLKKQKTNKINADHTFIKYTLKQQLKQQQI
ncbi:hypothetical protein VCHA48O428_160040 [Vibrio chagasii]|nr:hypothetical protein VCHA36O163_130040 [Vibrio chagasii]CAH6810765.1 hypothetical protein VCHA31O71_130062 [Vibrio chagasii]CAH6998766.1 hypothetical protein VCHA49P382_130078 [Vibrio chagasii]CAH7016179.1 hypothetical protein VCHA48O428_160040 [Vibrio chagasii]CAH7160991.1 hypothetical protein VCHA54O482_130062 [Vibrio chagasii]